MKITPLDIRKQQFSKHVRGYDSDEVDSFLEMVADEFQLVLKKAKLLAKELETSKARLAKYEQQESSLQSSIHDLQDVQRQKSEKAEEEASLIRQKAMLESDRILHEAERRRASLLEDIHRLEGQRKGFILKLKHVLQSQLELLDILDESISDLPNDGAGYPASRKVATQTRLPIGLAEDADLLETETDLAVRETVKGEVNSTPDDSQTVAEEDTIHQNSDTSTSH